MSQRKKGYSGGIQRGEEALDDYSRLLDKQVKSSRDALEVVFPHLTMIKRFSTEDKIRLVGDDCFGFSPDGGCWFKKKKLVAVFEAKKQGVNGNAHERWWDNAVTAKHINPDVMYVTFCTREGAQKGECLEQMSRKAKIMMGDNYIFYLSPKGFTIEEIHQYMSEILLSV